MDQKELIVSEAAHLFMKYGIRAVTMDSLANPLGMSKRTIYENFSDKDALLENVIMSMTRKQKVLFQKVMAESGNVFEVIFSIMTMAMAHYSGANPTYMVDIKKYHRRVYDKIMKTGDLKNYTMTMEILNRGIDEGMFRSDLNTEIVNLGIHGMIGMLSDNELLPLERYPTEVFIDNLLLNYLRGISTEEGLKVLNRYKTEAKF